MNMYLAYSAMVFAREMHADQKRKYTGTPYSDHLAEVAGIVATVLDRQYAGASHKEMIAVAWLHDVMEDQDVPFNFLRDKFNLTVAEGVQMLSDMEEGNRAERKRLSCLRLADAPAWVQTIKCADLISNTASIVQLDPKFAKTYLREKAELLKVLTKADPRLWDMAARLSGVNHE